MVTETFRFSKDFSTVFHDTPTRTLLSIYFSNKGNVIIFVTNLSNKNKLVYLYILILHCKNYILLLDNLLFFSCLNIYIYIRVYFSLV